MAMPWAVSLLPLRGAVGYIRVIISRNVSSMTCFSLLSLSEKFLYSYVIEYHVVEKALKERHLKGQSERAVIQIVLENEV